ncbi:MAG: hypothetical protein ACRYFA_13875 [Janthinobacterium lividum]
MKKITLFMLVLFATISLQACNSSNGDRAKGGESDTVGNQSNMSMKDSTNGLKDTLKH